MANEIIYVWATDKFLSGWGKAEGKIHKQVATCPDWKEANRMLDGFGGDSSYKYVGWGYELPRWNKARYTWTIRPSKNFTIYKSNE